MPVRKAILVNQTRQEARKEPKLAGVPLLVRAVLTAQRAGLEKVLIVGGPHPGGRLHDKRVTIDWQWCPVEADNGDPDELAALRVARDKVDEDFLLLFADSIVGPKALESLRADELDGKRVHVGTHAGTAETIEGASEFLCARRFLEALEEAPPGTKRVDEFVAWLRERDGVDTVEVEGKLWPRTTDWKELRRIEREFAHFNLKPSDGLFARFNKLVMAEGLIRLAVRTPATPNFITGVGLFFALWSGWAFAEGSYAWSIAGAFLAYLSAIMDHVDGMVARLKFLESEFGVWFESAVDYASYFCIFVGMAIGLYRATGWEWHLLTGGLFVFGGVMSFIVMSRQRKRVSADNLTDYPNRIHATLEKQKQNFFHWFARKCYFLVRRAVLPYFILLFCLLDLRVLLLGFATFGANVVWLMTLYNNRLFRRRTPAAHRPAEAD